ncbi:MAG: hemerythrin domain-containing protein [Candidatus Eisenbacteria bacterium]
MLGSTIFQRMRADHAHVLGELDGLERAARGGADGLHRERDLARLVRMLERQFATHMRAEDEVLFPALIEALPEARGSLAPLRAEHDELRSMLAGLTRVLLQPPGPAREEQIAVQARDLVDLLRIHVRKEEAIVFSVAERVLPEPTLQRIAERLEHPHPPNADGVSSE